MTVASVATTAFTRFRAEGERDDQGDPPARSVHAGGHVDPRQVERLLRSTRAVDIAALRDSAVPLDELLDY